MKPRRTTAMLQTTGGTLSLGACSTSLNRLHLSFGVANLSFSTTIWYEDVDFDFLRDRYGKRCIDNLIFHIAAFEASKLYSLRPERFDTGPYRSFVTREFSRLWETVLRHVWADWRYEHGRPTDAPPTVKVASETSVEPVEMRRGPIDVLSLCGGGKDSLLTMRLLESAGIPYASLAYSHSVYGRAALQHRLIDSLLDTGVPARRHQQWVIEDFLDSPVLRLRPDFDVQHLRAAETPASIFASLPVALMHGYSHLLVGHERSADLGNLVWDATGEEVNHQWGKSLQAERLLQRYIRENLISNVTYASLLKPLSDTIIFNGLEDVDRGVPHTHSCNEHKPWCERCPKCAYVWLGYNAYLPEDISRRMFSCNLFDGETNRLWFRQLLGMESHTPFDCVGGVAEARLMFESCRRKGMTGLAIDEYVDARLPLPSRAETQDLVTVQVENQSLPAELLDSVSPFLLRAGERARRRVLPLIESRARTGSSAAVRAAGHVLSDPSPCPYPSPAA